MLADDESPGHLARSRRLAIVGVRARSAPESARRDWERGDPHEQEHHSVHVTKRLLFRAIFTAAGGQHDDFDQYDRVMAAERLTAVLVPPTRITTNPAYARHVDRRR